MKLSKQDINKLKPTEDEKNAEGKVTKKIKNRKKIEGSIYIERRSKNLAFLFKYESPENFKIRYINIATVDYGKIDVAKIKSIKTQPKY